MGTQELTNAASQMGKKGGRATLKKFGKKHFKKLSDKAAIARKLKGI